MDVRAQGSRRKHPEEAEWRSTPPADRLRAVQGPGAEWAGQLLGKWQAREVRLARGYPECHDLSKEQLEDLYQETSVALLTRPYQTEEHLLNALRTGIRHRAKNLHRDERRRGRILAYSAPGMYAVAVAGADDQAPELAAIAQQDRLVVSEFLTELSPVEQRVFWLLAEGMQYRAIAPALGVQLNVARNASRAVERKRERFQLLYDTGRLCGFRAGTITALQSGQATTEELAKRAFAHLDSCAACRAEHKTNAKRLRGRFQGQATALLPMPALAAHLGWLSRVDARARTWADRLLPVGALGGSGGAREGPVALLATGGVTAKVAATVATVVVVAGGTTAGVVLDHGGHAEHRHTARHVVSQHEAQTASAPSTMPIMGGTAGAVQARSTSPIGAGRTSSSRGARAVASNAHREPGGFAYLGVPSSSGSAVASAASAHVSSSNASRSESNDSRSGETSSGGGQFSP
jgi:RNA polymerase sigma factor (sigma-70 family)